jgi:hypothetical protein
MSVSSGLVHITAVFSLERRPTTILSVVTARKVYPEPTGRQRSQLVNPGFPFNYWFNRC